MLWLIILALTLVVVVCLLSLFMYLASSEKTAESLCSFADREKQNFLLDDEDDVMWSQH